MSYINCGASVNGTRPASKKALREAASTQPEALHFDGTSPLGPQFSGPAENIPAGITLNVCGPDPYTKRSWFALVTRNASTGKITVK